MALQTLPLAATRYALLQESRRQAATREVRRLWRNIESQPITGWARIEHAVMSTATTHQRRMALDAFEYMARITAEQGINPLMVGTPNVRPLIGVSGDGRPLSTLLRQAAIQAQQSVDAGLGLDYALWNNELWLDRALLTALSDTARQAEGLAIAATPDVSGWVRMLAPPSCARCIILAGKWFKTNEGFERHPKCDCRHIPLRESAYGDARLDPQKYFNALSEKEQDRIFTNAGARAIRDGADPVSIVNARRGMSTSQSGLRTTTEGTTRRGWAAKSMYGNGNPTLIPRGVSVRKPRLMPESIYATATDRDDAINKLRFYGYL